MQYVAKILFYLNLSFACRRLARFQFKDITYFGIELKRQSIIPFNLKTIYSYASFPPKLGVDVFNDIVQQTSILYVPKDSYPDYWISDTWGNFENIKTFDASAVEPVFTADDASETSRYTVGGQKQDNPVKELNIIKMSDGSVKKIMVK